VNIKLVAILLLGLCVFSCGMLAACTGRNQTLPHQLVLQKPATLNHSGQIIWQMDSPKTVYLTFDDGPDPVNTPIILDILKKYNVKVTFFVLGHKAQKNPALIKRIKYDGHILGNHTFTHIDGTVVDLKKIRAEINSTHQLLQTICGVKVTLFRPPFGFFNWRVFAAAKSRGYQIALWTFDLSDWSVHSSDQYVKTVAENLADGAIILMHDGGPKREALIEALPKIIELIKKRGYKFSNCF